MSETLLRRIRYLSIFTIVYNIIEGIISIYLGVDDAASSLVAFGADSFIEVFSAMVVLWNFQKEQRNEARSLKIIAFLFYALGVLTVTGSIIQFSKHGHPETTLPGVIISLISLSFMYFLYVAKRRVGLALDSQTVLQDAACSLACMQLSAVLLIGSFLYLVAPQWWWVDATAALGIAYFIFKEGRETYLASHGEGHCCHH